MVSKPINWKLESMGRVLTRNLSVNVTKNSCKTLNIGQLTFAIENVACTTVADNQFYLCFDYFDLKSFYEASSPTGTFE